MNEIIKTYTIYLSNGGEALAALVIGLAALQATWTALFLFGVAHLAQLFPGA